MNLVDYDGGKFMDNTKLALIYDERVKSTKNSWESCGWGSEDEQYGRYLVVGSKIHQDASVLDVGCGEADFGKELKKRDITSDYTGVEISSLMLERARIKCPHGKFENVSLMDYSGDAKDIVVAIGTFNVNMGGDQYEYLHDQLKRCFELCKVGACATISINSQAVDVPSSSVVYWYDEKRVFDVIREISPYYIINTASAAMEMLVWMYRG